MHAQSMLLMSKFAETLEPGLTVLDVGSYDVNGNYKALFAKQDYLGLDIEAGPNVDIVGEPYAFPFKDGQFDVVVSGNCVEHVANPMKWVLELDRVLKPGGKLCVVTPHTIHYHPYPHDFWRVRKDGMHWLFAEWMVENGRSEYVIQTCEEDIIDTYIYASKV